MTEIKPRASIHVGDDKKSFSAQVSNEAERRGWDEKRYRLKNAEEDKNNHYNFSRKQLNFEIIKGGKIVPLGSNPVPLHERLQRRHDELGFKPYMDADHPGQVSENSPNCLVNIIFGGDHDVMKRLAFGDQELDTSDANADQSNIVLMQGVYDWALDTYRFACRKWGEENIIGFCVHCDETGIHAHVLTVPVEQVKKRGRIGSTYISKDNPNISLTTKEWKALSKEERANYTKSEATKDRVERVSYAKVWGETRKEKSEYLSQLHTDYHNEVGYKYGLKRGIPYEELSDEEKRERRHKNKVVLEAERQAKKAVEASFAKVNDAEQQKAAIETEVAEMQRQKEDAQEDLKTAQSGFLAKIFQPGKYKQKETTKIKDAYEAGVKETIAAILKATGLKWKGMPSAEDIGINFRRTWDSEKNLSTELKSKDEAITQKDAKIEELNVKVTKLTEEVNGLKMRLTLIDADAVERLRNDKDTETARANNAESELRTLRSRYDNLLTRWNALWNEPEYNEASRKVKARKEREAQQAAAVKREADARAARYNGVRDKFIAEGRAAQHAFAISDRCGDFNAQESLRIYYGIIALSQNLGIPLDSEARIKSVTDKFLDGCNWSGTTPYREECCRSWTHIFTGRDVEFPHNVIETFCDFVNYMSSSAETYASLGGSNGCADQLTNWDGTKKRGLGAPEKKKGSGLSV